MHHLEIKVTSLSIKDTWSRPPTIKRELYELTFRSDLIHLAY